MPVVPELRAVWDALRIQYQAVLGGFRQPREAARLSQREALRQIAAMNEVIQPDWQAVAVKVMLGVSSAALLVLLILQLPGLWRSIFRTHTLAWLLILPAFAAVFAIIVFPFVYNILLSFSNFSLRTFNQWRVVGFQQYAAVLRDPLFYTVFLKTVLWTAANLLFHVGLGVFLALLINRTLPAKPLFRVLLIVPWAVPQYITALTWRGMFNQEYGAVNLVLKQFLEMNPVQWLTQPFEAFAACVVTNVWLGFPFMMVVALGGLQSIPAELYEAARVDGAGRWQTFRRITWPMLRPVMAPAITLGAIWTFNNVNVVWLVSNGGEPSDKTHILVSYVYKAAFNLYRYGYGAALSVIIFLILLAFGAFYLHKSKAAESVYE
jgi:arabinogalactan oligomer/maltooligosaccharide transport system permease protein